MDFSKDGLNCLKCHHKNQDNGNCMAVGGIGARGEGRGCVGGLLSRK